MIPEPPNDKPRKPAFTPVEEDEWYENRKAVRKKLLLIPTASFALLLGVGCLASSFPRLPNMCLAACGGAIIGAIFGLRIGRILCGIYESRD